MDYLDTASWLPQAQKLQLGESRRVPHDCGGGRTLKISSTAKGLDAWCWRCGAGGFSPAPEESWQERIVRLAQEKAVDEQVRASLSLPTPMNLDPKTWPLHARVWLYKAGMTNDEIVKHEFYYHERTARVVLPVRENTTVSYWQARGFSKDRPKYLNPYVDRSSLVAKYKSPSVLGSQLPLVLTEDILSAIRVAHVADAWSLLGTTLPPKIATALIKEARPVAIWLDPDGAGHRGATKAYKVLSAYGVNCRVIKSDKDPKCYTTKEIECHLS